MERSIVVALIGIGSMCVCARAEDEARLRFIKQKLGEFHFAAAGDGAAGGTATGGTAIVKELVLTEDPAISYTNPQRSSRGAGATFFCLSGGRPVAGVSLSIRDDGRIFSEFSMLRKMPLRVSYQQRDVWSPRAFGKTWEHLPDSRRPSTSKPARLVQMRRLARRFEIQVNKKNALPEKLRLLSRPLHRYEVNGEVIDGAVFAFAMATDPEAMLVLEAEVSSDGGSWSYSLARMTSFPLEGRLDDQQIWSVPGYYSNPRSPSDPYIEAARGKYEEE